LNAFLPFKKKEHPTKILYPKIFGAAGASALFHPLYEGEGMREFQKILKEHGPCALSWEKSSEQLSVPLQSLYRIHTYHKLYKDFPSYMAQLPGEEHEKIKEAFLNYETHKRYQIKNFDSFQQVLTAFPEAFY